MTCPQEKVQIPLSKIVPDVAMADVQLPRVNFKDINVGKELGKGAFGKIYEGIWKKEQVAVKELIISDALEDDEKIDIFHEFRREVWLMSKLNHPCVVNIKGEAI